MATELETPILEGALKRIPFFNGRVLTAEDLQTEQQANAVERERLGRTLGTGVLEGLYVRPGNTPTTLSVESGQALAPSGRVVDLPSTVELTVVSEIEREETAGTEGRFASCSSREVVVTSGTGAYLLVVEPAAGSRGRTPRTRLGGDGRAGACGAQYRLEGAQLRLVPLDVLSLSSTPLREAIRERARTVSEAERAGDGPSPEDVSMLRSLLAHACLGTATTAGAATSLTDAFRGDRDQAPRYGAVDHVRQEGTLSDDAVPIGLLYWLRDHVEFVDVWAVRRRVHQRDAHTPALTTDRRRAEAEAAVFQFHDHLDALQDRGRRGRQMTAEDFFAYLPPVGVIGGGRAWPVFRRPSLSSVWPTFTTRRAIAVPREAELPDVPRFFEGVTVGGPSFVEPQRLRALTDEALGYPPLALDSSFPPDPGPEEESGPFVWLYLLAPNAPEEDAEPPFLFTTGYAPSLGDAQYDLSRVNRATYSSSSGPPSGS